LLFFECLSGKITRAESSLNLGDSATEFQNSKRSAMHQAKEFLNALAPSLPADQRLILCSFSGDPNEAPPDAWRPKPWAPQGKLGLAADWNVYVTVAAFRAAPDGTWRRRKSLFASGQALMVDDVGFGATAKVNPNVINIAPSAIIETSPENFQYWYFLETPEPDAAKFDAVIRAFIAGKLLGMDPGMAGITRVGRLPGFLNGKKKYNGFTTKLTELNDRAYALDELVEGFGLTLKGRATPMPRLATEESLRRNRAFVDIYKFLQARHQLKRSQPDMSGWTEMVCPWLDNHTGRVDNGAAICEPAEENGWAGAFRCHHGGCIEKHWRHLTEWVNDLAAEELEHANKGAHHHD